MALTTEDTENHSGACNSVLCLPLCSRRAVIFRTASVRHQTKAGQLQIKAQRLLCPRQTRSRMGSPRLGFRTGHNRLLDFTVFPILLPMHRVYA